MLFFFFFLSLPPPPLPPSPPLTSNHSRSSRVVSPLYEWAIVPEDRIPHTIWRLSQQKQGLTDNASLHLLRHCASQLCQGHVQLGFIHPPAKKKQKKNKRLRIKPGGPEREKKKKIMQIINMAAEEIGEREKGEREMGEGGKRSGESESPSAHPVLQYF